MLLRIHTLQRQDFHGSIASVMCFGMLPLTQLQICVHKIYQVSTVGSHGRDPTHAVYTVCVANM